ncbi:MAG: Ras-related protein Rab-23 [Promethearchaeota archaeon CR_4]|nr:MAG: Ras-related protein Rab-23 [Candidatus Lokiarchaeota archaeon CR_4]
MIINLMNLKIKYSFEPNCRSGFNQSHPFPEKITPMIEYVNILTVEGKSLVFREYGDAEIDQDLLAGFLSAFSGFMKELSLAEIKSTQTEANQFFYTLYQNVIVVICAGLTDVPEEIKEKVDIVSRKFADAYGNVLKEGWNGERSIFHEFAKVIDDVILGPIKVSIIGYGGVGKTSLLKLICGKEVNLEYIPTITADIANYNNFLDPKDATRSVVFWDFAGQLQFSMLWQSLLKGTKLALLVTDSTYQNVTESKKIITDLVKKYYENVPVLVIANKQDLQNRLSPELVEKLLGLPTVGMISINREYRATIHEALRKEINKINQKEGAKK